MKINLNYKLGVSPTLTAFYSKMLKTPESKKVTCQLLSINSMILLSCRSNIDMPLED